MNDIRLHTTRLRIAMMSPAHLSTFAAYRDHPDVARYQSWQHYSLDDAKALYRQIISQPVGTPGHWVQLAICDRHSGELLGDLALVISGQQAEVGYTVAPTHQRQGIASEALSALLGHLQRDWPVTQVQARIDCQNHASARVLEKCGFELVAVRKQVPWRDSHFDEGRYQRLLTIVPIAP